MSSPSDVRTLVDSGITDECSSFLSEKEHSLDLYHSGTMAVLHVAGARNHLESVSYTDGDGGLLIADNISDLLEVANELGLSR